MVRLRFRARRPAANLGPESGQWKAEPIDGWKLQQLIARLGSGLPIDSVRKRLRQSVWAPGSLSCEDPANSPIKVLKIVSLGEPTFGFRLLERLDRWASVSRVKTYSPIARFESSIFEQLAFSAGGCLDTESRPCSRVLRFWQGPARDQYVVAFVEDVNTRGSHGSGRGKFPKARNRMPSVSQVFKIRARSLRL